MYEGKTVGVVIPAYEEEGFVGEVIDTLPDYVDRVYAVDDESTDGTWEEIQRHARKANEAAGSDGAFDRRVVPIQHETNRGVGGAIKTGYLRALDDEIDVTTVMGGDGQMDPNILERIIGPVVRDEADYSKGNRLLNPETRERMSPWRFFGNSVLTFLTKIASGYWKTMDPQNGYSAISYEALRDVNIEEMYEYYGYCNDLLVKLNVHDKRVADVAMPAIYGDEESSIRYGPYIRNVSMMLLRNFFWRLKTKHLVLDFHPLALLYLLGTALVGLGTLLGVGSSIERRLSPSESSTGTGTNLLLVALGCLSLVLAMIFDMQESEDRETQIHE